VTQPRFGGPKNTFRSCSSTRANGVGVIAMSSEPFSCTYLFCPQARVWYARVKEGDSLGERTCRDMSPADTENCPGSFAPKWAPFECRSSIQWHLLIIPSFQNRRPTDFDIFVLISIPYPRHFFISVHLDGSENLCRAWCEV